MANALVVGGNGLLGSQLVDALARDGHRVRAFDRFSGGQVMYGATGVEMAQGEFLNRSDLEAAVAGQDLVFHFLSTTTPATAESDPTLDIRTNIVQSVELLESCVAAGVQHFYYASTGGAIYGNQGLHTYSEDIRPQPLSPYGIGKLAVEHYLAYYRRLHGLRTTVFRISNPYGPRQHPNKPQGLIPIALRRIAAGRPVVVYGDGGMVRDYILIRDAVEMMMRVVRGAPRSDIYNVGSGRPHTVNEVLETIERVVGRSFELERGPSPATFVDRVVLDIGRFEGEFGEVAVATLEDGIRWTAHEIGLIDG